MANTLEKMQAAGLVEPEETNAEVLEVDVEALEANSEDNTPAENTDDIDASLAADDDEFDGFELEDDEKAPSKEDKKQYAWKNVKQKVKTAKAEAKASNQRAEVAESEVSVLRKQVALLAQGQMKKPDMIDYDSQDEFLRDMNKYARVMQIAQPQQVTDKQVQDAYPTAQPAYDDSQHAEALDAHYARAEKSGLDSEKFANAERKVRETHGDMITDKVVDILGEGSEKVMYVLGTNEAALTKFNGLMASDESGFKAIAYLTELKLKVKPKRRTKSAAPEPDRAAKGASVTNTALQKQFDKADKAGDAGEMLKLRRQARKAGVKLH
jgi:hypothetical protein